MSDCSTATKSALIKSTHRYYALVVLLLCSSFLFYKYILQNFPSIITTQLMADFHLSGAGLGNLTATFFYSFIIMQLMVGVLLDKWSPRYLTAVAILLCGIGSIAFSYSDTELSAGLTRALMGIGVAFATIAYMKLAAVWFDTKYYALIGGLLVTAAMAGAVFGQAPLSFFIQQYGWRTCLYSLGLFGVGLALIFVIVVRDYPKIESDISHKTPVTWSSILSVLLDKRNWMLTLYSGLAFSPLAIFGGLWGNPFLQEAYHLTATEAASALSLAFIGLGLGSPLLGLLSDRFNNRWHMMVGGTLLSLLCLSAIIYSTDLSKWMIGFLLFGFGFFLGVFMLAFTVGKEINSLALTATVVAMINASDAILDAITDPLIGHFLDWSSHGRLVNGIHYFNVQDYRYSLSILPLYLVSGIVCMCIFRKLTKKP